MTPFASFARAAAIAAGLLLPFTANAAAPAPAPKWTHTVAGGENTVRYRDGGYELTFRCLGTSVELVLYVETRLLDTDIRGRANTFFALLLDDADIFSFQGKMIVDGATTSIGSGGRTANDFVHYIAGAKSSVRTSLLTMPPGVGALHYNLKQYPLAGAAEAFKAAYANCGILF